MAISLYLYLMAVTLALAVFAPNRAVFRIMFLVLLGGLLGQYLSAGELLPGLFQRLNAIALVVVFGAGAVAMSTRRLPAMLALPALAVGFSVIGLVRWDMHLSHLAGTSLPAVLSGSYALAEEIVLATLFLGLAVAVAWWATREAFRVDWSAGMGLTVACLALAGAFGQVLLAPVLHHWRYRGGLGPLLVTARGVVQDGSWILSGVVGGGASHGAAAAVIVITGAMLATFLDRAGLTRTVTVTLAEYGGDSPRRVAALILVLVTLTAATVSGLAVLVMLGILVLPLLAAVGVAADAAAGLVLFGIGAGGIVNPANWEPLRALHGITESEKLAFALPLFLAAVAVAIVYLLVEIRAGPGPALTWHARTVRLPEAKRHRTSPADLVRFWRKLVTPNARGVRPLGLATPLVPPALAVAGVDPTAAILLGLAFGVALHAGPRRRDLLASALVDGIRESAPVVATLLGLGMLTKALTLPTVSAGVGGPEAVGSILSPYLGSLATFGPVSYVLVFLAVSPVVLYRGPINVSGLGSGLVASLSAPGALAPHLVMGVVQSTGSILGVIDPFGAPMAWMACAAGTTAQRVLRRAFPYAIVTAALGLVLSALCFSHLFRGG